MPPRRAPAAPRADDDVNMYRMTHAMYTMAAAVTAQTRAKAQRAMEKRKREVPATGLRTSAGFHHQAPPRFNGEGGPDAADLWLQAMEGIFEETHCPEGERVFLATYSLLGGSEYWWRNTRFRMEVANEEVTWENFKREFSAKYFSETAKERYGDRFLKLCQDSPGSNRSVNPGTRGSQGGGKRVCYNCRQEGHYARDCKAPRAEPSVDVTRGARPAARGGAYRMDAGVSGQAGNAMHEDY